ncbi:phosphate ABC transporter substrate-binding protein [Ktedonosporobacter rubrisoli]|uniref:Phosphate ABC transporter substrate-binding protein n=1 Tax=Ktedonosporobacter rubrisoli TaxID=2509675 RepID=A0A4P6K330_KTERU|nr:phosphate ABC transporter substrate-binding protein [Ktedonosporobacter rubrisoli]QBD82554.1 phosphate ABC transporter substrate-binding protein [Ktedonosporobacter rubrisoli]
MVTHYALALPKQARGGMIRSIRSLLLLVGIMMVTGLTGCVEAPHSTTDLSGHIQIVGSTALQPLANAAATLFQKQHPQTSIEVQGGGSLAGLQAVTAHKANIGNSDVYADPAIYPDPNLTDHIVCVIPFAMVVGPGISITSLTQQQIIDIFSTGKIHNWQQIGGPDLPIVPVVRPPTSGTRDTFRKYILGGRDEKGTLLKTDSSATVLDVVARTPGAIGYLALSVLTPKVHALAISGVMPTLDNITTGRYLFWGYEHMYSLDDNNATISAFLDFMLTPEVQQQAQQMGYIPIARMRLAALSRTYTTASTLPIAYENEVIHHESL